MILLKCNTVKQYCPYYNSRWVSFSVKREGMWEKLIRNEEKNKNKREGEIETANEIKWKMVFIQKAFICVCIGPNYSFASIQFFVGLAWSVCVLHCSAWMWLCLHWIIWALLSLYQLFALSETDPQVCVCLDLHARLVNLVMLFVVTY